MENEHLHNDASILMVIDEINSAFGSAYQDGNDDEIQFIETSAVKPALQNGSDDEIQFIQEVKASTTARKRKASGGTSNGRLSTTSNGAQAIKPFKKAKRRKISKNGDGQATSSKEGRRVQEVEIQGTDYDEYVMSEPGNSSPDINEDEIQALYSNVTEERRTLTRTGRGRLQGVPKLNANIWNEITAYREKYPKQFAYFDNQILKHYDLNIQNDATFAWKLKLRSKILTVIHEAYSNAELFVTGSTINGTGSFNADMDLCCMIANPEYLNNEKSFAMKTLKKIRSQLYRHKKQLGMDNCQLITAKVPILRLTFNHPNEYLEVDLNVNNLAGVYNSYLLHYYSRIDDRFPALCLLIKHWAKRNSIGQAMNGMLNSYSIILLVIHFLQVAISPPILPNLQESYPHLFNERRPLEQCLLFQDLERNYADPSLNTRTAGELLIAFFDYYTNFDFHNWGISIAEARLFHRALAASNERYKIFIEEPFDKCNTARCVTSLINFDIIKETFRNARLWFLGKRRPDIKNIGVSDVFKLDT